MKFLLVIMSFFAVSAAAQELPEIIDVYAEGNIIVAEDKNVYANCCSIFASAVGICENDVNIVFTDTSTTKCRCMCYFDLTENVSGLEAGDYTVNIFRQEWKKFDYPIDTLIFLGKYDVSVNTTFSIKRVDLAFEQSPCHTVGINTQNEDEDMLVSPNPACDKAMINIRLQRESSVSISVFDMNGNKALSSYYPSLNSGEQSLYLDLRPLAAGAYNLNIRTDSFTRDIKLIVNR